MKWYYILLIVSLAIIIFLTLSILLYRKVFKRIYDIILSLIAIIILSPFFLIFTPINAIAMKGNPFFCQYRPGKKNKNGKCKIFKLIKYRSMTNEKDKNGNLLPDDKRLTKFGKFLRSTSLDELPELFNIFIGDMSIVGPRPQLIKDMAFFSDNVMHRQDIRPGLTGLAQVNGRNNITWEEKFNFDLNYVSNYNLFLDIKIILKTILKVFKRSDINRDGTVSDIDYGDWLLKENQIAKYEYEEKQKEAKELLRG